MTEHRRIWGWIIGAVALLLFLGWIAGTNNPGMLLALGVVGVGFAAFLWRKDRLEMRSARRDLRPTEEAPPVPEDPR